MPTHPKPDAASNEIAPDPAHAAAQSPAPRRSGPRSPRLFGLAAVLIGACAVLTAPGCGSAPISETPMLDTRNPGLKLSRRLDAADLAWADAQSADPATRAKAREVFKSLVWSPKTPRPLRLKLAGFLFDDQSPEGLADSRLFTVLRLPTESDRAIAGMMAIAAARHNWTDAAPSLVRSLSSPVDDIPDAERTEALALQRLFPGKPLERIVFDIFGDPTTAAAPPGIDFEERVRADAWSLLSRLDPTGDARRSLILDPGPAAMGSAGPLLADLRAAVTDFGVVPSTSMELEWLRRLRDPAADANRRWWNQTRQAIASVPQERRLDLGLRHLEPIRFTAQTRPQRLTEPRDALLAEFESRLEPREHHRRTAETSRTNRGSIERLEYWKDRLSWADLVALLAIDDAVQTGSLAATIAEQTELDRDDRTTEYGGVIEAVDSPDGSVRTVRAVLFPPRQRDRVSDERFIASQDMLDYSDRALAHYHLQVQKAKNYDYAGPSSGDFQYAALSGRTCVVFTSLSENRLNADVYQPNGVAIDLGEIRR